MTLGNVATQKATTSSLTEPNVNHFLRFWQKYTLRILFSRTSESPSHGCMIFRLRILVTVVARKTRTHPRGLSGPLPLPAAAPQQIPSPNVQVGPSLSSR